MYIAGFDGIASNTILSLTVEREKSPPNPGCARERGLLLI